MSKVNWNKGNLIELSQGDTAICAGNLNYGQLYCLFFYNAAGNDTPTPVHIVGTQGQAPVVVNVPGTTQNQGLAALCFVDGSETNTISASVLNGTPGAKIQAFIGSVKMPLDTSGINNRQIPMNGQMQSFTKFTRYYGVPESHWYSGRIQSNINQFISVQFTERKATVFVVNQLVDPTLTIGYYGNSKSLVTIDSSNTEYKDFNLQGNGQQFVWINADSIQNSNSASIVIQSLMAIYNENITQQAEALTSYV
ncbi:hypothetical protein [Marinifilum sp. D714]|uniref:hypothetical protein n=1 Tax=Marinifilum sp. D714 TaxID=2937523 RepID=UPI0027BC5C9D|nr:hypothetical protein [Marinifilum sp. D714]MDQ2179996.1 hypothetical protein [Marinifilum sp. D714]